jgi:hypothetical protein
MGGPETGRRVAALLIVLFLVTFAFAHTTFAQITAATVSGTIRDQRARCCPASTWS